MTTTEVTGRARRPARNRVTPLGDIVAVPGRGTWTGNRGRLHAGPGTDPPAATTRDLVRTSAARAWLTCRLEFRGRRIAQWHPHHYTPLFLPDEPAALAADHRPCAECRHADFVAFRDAAGATSAPGLDARLHAERGRCWTAPWRDLPDGTFVLLDGLAALVAGDEVRPFDVATFGYAAARSRPRTGPARVVTPPTTVGALRAGYRPRTA